MSRSALLSLAVGLAALLAPSPGPATESARAAFEVGLSHYENGRYEEAVDTFAEILAAGADDPVVHYNLANSWFKSGRLGLAIYHYRRALALAPRDEDVAANLEYARFLALDSLEEEETRTDQRVVRWIDRVTPWEVARVAMILWVLAGVAGVFWQLSPAGNLAWRRSFVALLALWAVFFAGAWGVDYRAHHVDEGVVLPPETAVLNGPGDSFETAFVLHEGAEVVVEGERGSWTEISVPGDLRGWISTEAIARL